MVILIFSIAWVIAVHFDIGYYIFPHVSKREHVRDSDYQIMSKIFPRRMPRHLSINKIFTGGYTRSLLYSVTCDDRDPSETLKLNDFRSITRPMETGSFPQEMDIKHFLGGRTYDFDSFKPIFNKAYEKETLFLYHSEGLNHMLSSTSESVIGGVFLIIDDHSSPTLRFYMSVNPYYEDSVLRPSQCSEMKDVK